MLPEIFMFKLVIFFLRRVSSKGCPKVQFFRWGHVQFCPPNGYRIQVFIKTYQIQTWIMTLKQLDIVCFGFQAVFKKHRTNRWNFLNLIASPKHRTKSKTHQNSKSFELCKNFKQNASLNLKTFSLAKSNKIGFIFIKTSLTATLVVKSVLFSINCS